MSLRSLEASFEAAAQHLRMRARRGWTFLSQRRRSRIDT